MLKTWESTESATQPREGVVGVAGDSRAGGNESKLDGSELDGGEFDDGEVENDEFGKKVQKTSKSKKTVGSSDFLTLGTKLAFIKLRQVFFKAPILYHFDPECHIRIETNVSDYAIGVVLSQLTLDDSGQWHLVIFFSWKMIPIKIRYKTHNGEVLAIIEAFKT